MVRRVAHRHLKGHRCFMGRCCPFAFVAVFVMGAMVFASPPDTTLNEMCPVMTEEKVDPEITLTHRGKVVALCCDSCVKKFKANPARYESRLPQFADAGNETSGGRSGEAGHGNSDLHEHSDANARDTHAESSGEAASGSLSEDGHDHSGAGDDDEREPFFGRLHPIIIHFPIAGFPLALLGFLVWVRTGREAFARSDAIPLFVATLASIAAVITGNIAHDAMRFSESLHVVVERHQYVSTAVMVIAICLSLIRVWRWNALTQTWRWVYGGGLAVACALLGYTGFLGGSLVFGVDHLAW
ncbi:MAG: hypothetical protein GXP29_14080 [Planctomycetes bacterium]|nr:hypothetical protein [Planctomycetota bacterium]